MATPGHISQVGTATSATSSTGTDVVVTKPTGVQDGDVLIAFGCTTESAPYFDTVPSGFTSFADSADADTPNAFRATAWRKVASSEPANYTFGSSGAETAGAPLVVTMLAFRNVNTTTPVPDVSEIAGGTSAEPANPATSFTQTGDGRLFYMRAARSTTAIPTFTNGTSNWTEQVDVGDFSGGTVRYGMAVYVHDFDTDGGAARSEPAITCGTTETDNVYILGCLLSNPPSDTDSGTVTETESFSPMTFGDSDSGTVTESELVTIPIADSDSGTVTEGESVSATTHHYFGDNFNRGDESPLNISSSGAVWTNV